MLASGHPWGSGNIVFFNGVQTNVSSTMLFHRSTNRAGIGTNFPLYAKLKIVNDTAPNFGTSQYGLKSDITQANANPVGGCAFQPFVSVSGNTSTSCIGENDMREVEGSSQN